MKELKTKTGRITRYGLSCGYVEKHECGAKIGMENGVVRVWCPTHEKWEYYNSLATARKMYGFAVLQAKLDNQHENNI